MRRPFVRLRYMLATLAAFESITIYLFLLADLRNPLPP